MALKVRKNGAWVDIADIGGITYDLLGGGTAGGAGTFGTGVGKIILRPSSGDDDEVSITGGSNIRIDGNSATGFTINADTGSSDVADKIQEGNTKAEVIDTGTDGRFLIEIDGVEALRVDNQRHLVLKPSGMTNLEGGHLQFENPVGNTDYGIDVYSNNGTEASSVLRIIDEVTRSGSTGTQRFCVNRSGALAMGHTGAEDYGTSGYALVSQGASAPPKWEDLSAGAATTFLSLGDTPANYTGQAHKLVRVNKAGSSSNGTALEFISETTYALSAVDGDDAASEKIRLTPTSGTTSDVTLKVINGLSIARTNNLITIDGAGAGTNTTYNLKLSGSNGDNGQAVWTLDGTSGTDTTVTLKAGNNISISSLSGTGSGTSGEFQIDAAGPDADTYSLPVTASGNDIKLSLTPADGTTPAANQVVTIEKGNNVTLTKTTGNNFKIDVDASSITGTTYQLKATRAADGGSTGDDDDPYLFLDASGSETDSSVRLVGSGSVEVTRNNAGNIITINGTGSGTGTTYTLPVFGTSNGSSGIKLTPDGGTASSAQTINITGSGNISVTGSGQTLTIDGSSVTGTTYQLQGGGTNGAAFPSGGGTGTINLKTGGSIQDTVTVTAGDNIRIDNTGVGGFQIHAADVGGTAFLLKNSGGGGNSAAVFDLYPSGSSTGASNQKITVTPGTGIEFTNTTQGLIIQTKTTEGGRGYDLGTRTGGKIRLTGSDSTTDDITFVGAGGISVTSSGNSLNNGTITITGGTASDAYSLPVNDNGTGVQIKLTPKSSAAASNQIVSINAGDGIKLTPSGQSFTIEVEDIDQGFVPVGVIVAYNGSSAPGNKWALCNGSNGTPNLVDKFIIGAGGSYSVGSTGGDKYKGIGHTHNITATTATKAGIGDHNNHWYTRVDNFASGGGDASNRRAPFQPVNVATFPPPGGFSGRHAHTMDININSGMQREGFRIADNLPPFYALVYIMRIAA